MIKYEEQACKYHSISERLIVIAVISARLLFGVYRKILIIQYL